LAIEFVYFDLGNVLLHFDHQRAARQMAEVAGITAQQAWEAVFADDRHLVYERGGESTLDFFEAFCERTSSRSDLDALIRAASDIFEPNESMISCVQAVRANGFRTGILSNTNDAHWSFVLENYSFVRELFDIHALSFEIRELKPARRIYDEAARLAGVPIDAIFFVDDREENIDGARQAGYQACIYDTTEKVSSTMRGTGLL